MSDLLKTIPGLREAIDREQFIRDQSFLELPTRLCGVEVPPLTLRRLLWLQVIGSPFIVGGPVQDADIGVFFLVAAGQPTGWRRWRLLRRVSAQKIPDLMTGIQQFLDEEMMDSNRGGTSGGQSYYSACAGAVDLLASEYGWPLEQILDLKLRVLFQQCKAITKRRAPRAALFNPSSKIIGRWLDDVNAGRVTLEQN